MHWKRWYRHGDPSVVKPPGSTPKMCSVPDCGKRQNAKGYCDKHYDRWRKYGDPLTVQVIRGDDVARFWSKVDQSGDCWVWIGACWRGYGVFAAQGHRLAHRFSYALGNGPIPPGMLVCHHCDNPPCVRPDHLYLGDNATNTRDRTVRGRGVKGSASPNTRLSDADVAEIRARYADGESQPKLARAFGIGQSSVNRIVLNRTYRG